MKKKKIGEKTVHTNILLLYLILFHFKQFTLSEFRGQTKKKTIVTKLQTWLTVCMVEKKRCE